MLYVGSEGQQDQLERALRDLSQDAPDTRRISPGEALARVPVLRASGLCGAIIEEEFQDIDVHALHQGYLRGLQARRRGRGAARRPRSARCRARWRPVGRCRLADGQRRSTRRVVVNAAGAWADVVAGMAGAKKVGLKPRRRGIIVPLPAGMSPIGWPCVGDLKSTWYFKTEGGKLMVSPADETPVEPQDIQPDEMDVAIGIDRFMQATIVEVRRPERTWAGLRSFVADKELVIGYAPDADGFFWLAAQGGYGIQSSAGAAMLAAALLRGEPPARLARYGMDSAVDQSSDLPESGHCRNRSSSGEERLKVDAMGSRANRGSPGPC